MRPTPSVVVLGATNGPISCPDKILPGQNLAWSNRSRTRPLAQSYPPCGIDELRQHIGEQGQGFGAARAASAAGLMDATSNAGVCAKPATESRSKPEMPALWQRENINRVVSAR